MSEKMQPGEKYLTIKLVGHNDIKVFPNKKKQPGDKQPDFIVNGVAVWVNTIQAKKEETTGTL